MYFAKYERGPKAIYYGQALVAYDRPMDETIMVERILRIRLDDCPRLHSQDHARGTFHPIDITSETFNIESI